MTGEIFIQGETRGEESKGRPILFKSRAADKKAIERLTSLCTAGPSVASKKKWLKVRQTQKEKEGKKGRAYLRAIDAQGCNVGSLLKGHLCPLFSGSLSRRGRRLFRRRLTSTTVAGHNHLIAFLLLHGQAPFIGKTVNGDKVPSPDPTPSDQPDTASRKRFSARPLVLCR